MSDTLEQAMLESELALADETLITPVNEYLLIDPETRLIEVPESESLFGVYSENDVEVKHFACPKIVLNNIDLSQMYIFINYVSASGRYGQTLAKNIKTSEDGNYVTFDWELTGNVFDLNTNGKIYFAVMAKKQIEDKEPVFATRKASGFCYETIEAGEIIQEQYADIILEMLTRIEALENRGTGGSSFSGKASDVTYDDTETELGVDNVQNAIDKLSEEVVDYGIEPKTDDIPKIFFDEAMPQTKDYMKTKFRYISKTLDVEGYVEFKAQGNSTLRFPKKNQTVKMYKDEALTEKLKIDFKGWGKQSKHVYKAYWNDLTHARDIVSARIWADIVRSRSNYETLPELLKTSPNQGAIDGFPVKVYSQGIYQGRYALNIPKDAWMANMDDELDTHCILCGEGFVSGCFREASMAEWTDEIHDTVPNVISDSWIGVINFVMNSTDEEFKSNLDNYIDKQSAIDYHLFNLANCGMDSYGKNQLFLTYDAIKWYASVYDMDATWGMSWNGGFVATDYPRTSYEDMGYGREGHLLYIRLEELFWDELRTRWFELRKGALSDANVINHFERFTDICPPWLVEEDYASTTANGKFTGIPQQGKNNIQQLRDYAVKRMAWVDEYFYRVPATGIALSHTELTFADITPITLTATIEPSDSTDTVVWSSTDETVAIVSDGVVTPLKNGNCTIRAIAGVVSASCEVSVVGIVPQYTIANTLLGATNSNANTVIDEGSTYTAMISANDGYTLEGANVTIMMGGEDITSTAYANGTITIENVTGNIEITVKAVDTSVAYSLEETVMDGSVGCGVDTGIMLQDTTKDYTIFLDFTSILNSDKTTGMRSYLMSNETFTSGNYAGYDLYNQNAEISGAYNLFGVKLFDWGDVWNKRCKAIIRFSDGVYSVAVNGATTLTDVEGTEQWMRNHTKTLNIGQANATDNRSFTGTIHSVKVWFEAKTDEECIAMLN